MAAASLAGGRIPGGGAGGTRGGGGGDMGGRWGSVIFQIPLLEKLHQLIKRTFIPRRRFLKAALRGDAGVWRLL
ncbi:MULTISPECIES: hypothetical protein [Cyanophyceae]|uniref:hypothetical protein n=1 Tax=Cyanophyceae TaxID=3028117 RepID=UPI00168945FE|nr:hypothetical protein [Trichocoleus sp. FACHB-40]MBD2002105.1 hypothetical protein [Trichocoleus sp. FACHB-40]